MDIEFNVGSRIKVIDDAHPLYRARGTITIMPEYLKDERRFADTKCWCNLTTREGAKANNVLIDFDAIATIQKKFIDIEHIRETAIDIGGVIRKGNIDAFEVGDIIQITEKIDGANASIAFNADEGRLEIFSRTNLLDGVDGLRGFKAYVETKFKPDEFEAYGNLVIFGEWCVPHKCQYDKSWYNVWRVYDIWDKVKRNYMPQSFVKNFCWQHGLEYIHELYNGPFVSWEHCRSFMQVKSYGSQQEGIVVKNQTKLDVVTHGPKYLKIVNDDFKESMVKKPKVIDPEQVKAYNESIELAKSVATEARVRKMLLKLVDEGKLPTELSPKDMGVCCKLIPKMVYEDLIKEEPEIMMKLAENAGKLCNKVVIEHVRKFVLGN